MSAKKFAYVQIITANNGPVLSIKLDQSNEDDMRKLGALMRGDVVTFDVPLDDRANYVDHLDRDTITFFPSNAAAIKVLYYTEGLKDVPK